MFHVELFVPRRTSNFMQISEHVYFYLSKGVSSNSSLVLGKKQILVDSRTNLKRSSFLFQQIRNDGLDPEKIDEIWLTHAHPDHVACAWKIQKKLKCKIISSQKAKEILAFPSPLYTFIRKEQKEIDKLRN